MKVEAAPTLFLITILAVVVLVSQIAAGQSNVASQPANPWVQPAIQLAGISYPELTTQKSTATSVALLRAPIALEPPDLPQR